MESIFRKGSLAVITGGASGIGYALAQRCVEAGMNVLVADKNPVYIEHANKTLGQGARAVQVDVSRPEDWASLKKIVDTEHSGHVSLLALNAGIKPDSSFGSGSLASFKTTFDVNVYGVVAGIEALLPAVRASAAAGDRSALVITGSKQGITNPPGWPAYGASKAAVKSIAEQLSYDLKDVSGLSVHLLIPGWVHTGLSGRRPDHEPPKPDGAWWPEQVVELLEKKIAEDQFWILCPDGEVTEALDKNRMLWSVGDTLEGRPPLSRWRAEYKEAAERFTKQS
ncbi:short chain dehydrogenase reductase [Colletotrichum plurivorum]|uniref:Short chain dehydrogenase reductase n=1 Tax=Colletotrichum plurivorum TaxID=2175906 RepID=A0A8H6KQN1_9PEZI|nr:short chain dehydrogenase reductase [Colletotrichum plurivorum]